MANELARALAALARCKGDATTAISFARAHYGETSKVVTLIRSIIDTGSLGDAKAFADLIAAVPSQSIIAAIDAVSPFRRSGPGVPVLVESAAPAAAWRAEGGKIVISNEGFEIVRLDAARSIAGIVLFTREAASELGDVFVRQLANDVGGAINAAESDAFLNPGNAGSDTTPQAITNGSNAVTVASSGSTADAIRADMASALTTYGGDLSRSVWACSSATAVRLAMLGESLGASDVTVAGGSLAGLPLCCSRGAPDDVLALLDPSGICVCDGGAAFDTAEQTVLEVTNDDDTVTMHTLWQENLSATRFVRVLDWKTGRPDCVAAITGIAWNTTAP